MAENIYSQIGKIVGKDVRLVRAAAHHPFEFYSKIMEDPKDHRPIRFRYLGAFFVKPYWRKGLRNINKIGPPPEGVEIWARVPEVKFNKTYINLKKGIVNEEGFSATDGSVKCPLSEVQFWGPDS
jgi:hypothetical protein